MKYINNPIYLREGLWDQIQSFGRNFFNGGRKLWANHTPTVNTINSWRRAAKGTDLENIGDASLNGVMNGVEDRWNQGMASGAGVLGSALHAINPKHMASNGFMSSLGNLFRGAVDTTFNKFHRARLKSDLDNLRKSQSREKIAIGTDKDGKVRYGYKDQYMDTGKNDDGSTRYTFIGGRDDATREQNRQNALAQKAKYDQEQKELEMMKLQNQANMRNNSIKKDAKTRYAEMKAQAQQNTNQNHTLSVRELQKRKDIQSGKIAPRRKPIKKLQLHKSNVNPIVQG